MERYRMTLRMTLPHVFLSRRNLGDFKSQKTLILLVSQFKWPQHFIFSQYITDVINRLHNIKKKTKSCLVMT